MGSLVPRHVLVCYFTVQPRASGKPGGFDIRPVDCVKNCVMFTTEGVVNI